MSHETRMSSTMTPGRATALWWAEQLGGAA